MRCLCRAISSLAFTSTRSCCGASVVLKRRFCFSGAKATRESGEFISGCILMSRFTIEFGQRAKGGRINQIFCAVWIKQAAPALCSCAGREPTNSWTEWYLHHNKPLLAAGENQRDDVTSRLIADCRNQSPKRFRPM